MFHERQKKLPFVIVELKFIILYRNKTFGLVCFFFFSRFAKNRFMERVVLLNFEQKIMAFYCKWRIQAHTKLKKCCRLKSINYELTDDQSDSWDAQKRASLNWIQRACNAKCESILWKVQRRDYNIIEIQSTKRSFKRTSALFPKSPRVASSVVFTFHRTKFFQL